MNNLDGIVLQDARQSPDRSAATPRTLGSAIVAYCIALPLFGRAVFPLARDKAHITLASSFTDPQIVTTYLVALIVMSRLFAAGSLFGQEGRGRVAQRLLLFVAVCLVSSFASRFPLFSVWRSFEVLLLGLWAAVMIRDSSGASDPAAAIRAFYAISVAILVGVFIGLVINPNGAWSMEGDVARLTGTTGYSINPNDIGAIAAVLSVGCYVRAVERGSLRYLVAMLLSFAVCYVSHSRGSYVAFAAGFVAATCMLARLERRRAIVAATSGVAVMLLAAACLVSQSVRGFFVFLMTRGHESGNLDSLGGRWQLWEFGLKVFRQHPMLGTGYGTYPEGLEGGHFHNVFIELIVTTGILGAVGYVAFLLALVAAARRWIRGADRGVVGQRIAAADMVTIPAVIIVANGATAGAAYYSWDLLGLVSVAVAASIFVVRRSSSGAQPEIQMPFSNLMT